MRWSGFSAAALFVVVAAAVCTAARATVPVSVISQWGGPCKAADVSGNYVYMGMGPRLVALDVSDSTNPKAVWQSEPFRDVIRGVTVRGGFAYVTGKEGLMIFDLSNPASPTPRGVYLGGSEDGTVGVVVPGTYVCITDTYRGLIVVDVSNPDFPTQAATCDLSGEGYSHGVILSGSLAYVHIDGGFCIVDLTDPTSPQFVNRLWTGDTSGATMANGYMYVTLNYEDMPSEMAVVDVSNPPYATYIGRCSVTGKAYGVTVSGNRAYVATGEAGLSVVDISNPQSPAVVGACDTPGIALGASVAGGKAYVASDYGGLQIVDVSNASSPSVLGGYHTSADGRKPALSNGRLYMADGAGGLQILDISDPTTPQRLGGYDTPGYANDVTLVGNYAYVADGEAGLQILDVTDPANPVRVGGYDTDGDSAAVAVSGGYAYVADQGAGLQVIDISDPTAPVRVGSYDPQDWVSDVAVSGNYAYVTAGVLRVLDISDPAHPVVAASDSLYSSRRGVYVAGGYAYTLDIGCYLYIYDVTNPASPVYVGSYARTDTMATDVVVRDSYAYLTDLTFGLQVVDVSVPSRTALVGEEGLFQSCYGVAVSGSYVFRAMGELGLEVCRVGTADAPTIASVTPNTAPDSGAASIEITGTGFQPGAEVKLTKAGQSDIVATDVTVVSSTKILCTAGITAKTAGAWNVVVTNPGSLSGFLLDAFTIMDTTPPSVTSVYVDTTLVPVGTRLWVGVDVTDNTGVVSVSADGYELNFLGRAWGKYIPAPAVVGVHTVTVIAKDAAGNTATDSSHSCKVARVVGTVTQSLLNPLMADASTNFIFRIWGNVTKVDDNNFMLDDGSGNPILVNFWQHNLQTGDYAQAMGEWRPDETAPLLYATPYSISRIK